MDIGSIDPDYDFSDSDCKFENLPKDEQEWARKQMAKADLLKKEKESAPV